MPSPRSAYAWRRLPLVLPLLAALVLGVLGSLGSASRAYADHAGDAPGPVNAGNTYGWWHHDGVRWMEHWETGRLAQERWRIGGRGVVQHQFGMLTLNTAQRGSVSATLLRPGQAYGRWEIRLRARSYETDGTDYLVQTELVPSRPADWHCGARNVALERFSLGGGAVDLFARNGSAAFEATQAVNHRDQRWHTYAVEVTPRRIAWFVDAHVVRTERRPAALSGVPLTVRFKMQGVKGADMNRSRMQMDWLRHFNLNAPNEKPTKAPRTSRGTYDRAC